MRNKLFQKIDKEIQASFLKLSRHLPIDKISVSSICRDVGINRSSFYYHYQDIYDLLDKIMIQTNRQLEEQVSLDANHFLSDQNLLLYLYHIQSHQDIYKIIYSSRTHFPMSYYSQEMMTYLKEETRFSEMTERHLSHVLTFIQAGFVYTIRYWIENQCKEKPEMILEVLRKFF